MDGNGDRDEVGQASLDATERLRARLTGRPLPVSRSRPVLPWVIAAVLLTFALGLIANPWFERNVRGALPFAGAALPATAADAASVEALKARLAAIEARTGPANAPAPAERLARTEAQVDATGDLMARNAARIDQMTRDVAALSAKVEAGSARDATMLATATDAAARAQAALTVLLVRRAVEAGRPLGPLDAALRQSFEARYPAAVQSVSALGATPVTLASLRRDFDALRPRLEDRAVVDPSRKGWLDVLADTLSSAVSSAPAKPAASAAGTPVEAAAATLQRGDVAAAAAQLRRLPEPRRALVARWLAAADRLRAGSEALATLELATAAVPVGSVAAR